MKTEQELVTLRQQLAFLDTAASAANGTRLDHVKIQEAAKALEGLITEVSQLSTSEKK